MIAARLLASPLSFYLHSTFSPTHIVSCQSGPCHLFFSSCPVTLCSPLKSQIQEQSFQYERRENKNVHLFLPFFLSFFSFTLLLSLVLHTKLSLYFETASLLILCETNSFSSIILLLLLFLYLRANL